MALLFQWFFFGSSVVAIAIMQQQDVLMGLNSFDLTEPIPELNQPHGWPSSGLGLMSAAWVVSYWLILRLSELQTVGK
jgi:hypothetical protein